MTEPSISTLGGTAPRQVAARLFLATRPKFFVATVLPVLLGTALGYRQTGALDGIALALAVIAVVLVHAGINVLNDVYDSQLGNDECNDERIYPYTGGSRFIQNGILDIRQMSRLGWSLLGAAILVGIALTMHSGIGVIGFGLAGVAFSLLYSAPPVRLSARGLGQVAAAIGAAGLPVVGADWLQSGVISTDAAFLSIPVAFWVANVMLINEIPDRSADAAVGRRTLAVRLSDGGAARLYFVFYVGAIATLGTMAAISNAMPVWGLAIPLLLTVPAVGAARTIAAPARGQNRMRRAIEATIAIHAAGTLSLIGAVVFGFWS